MVRENLHDFLVARWKRISRPSSTLPIFIDAVCINQSDTRERNHQVAMMSDVYENADEVVIWLGKFSSLRSVTAVICYEAVERLLRLYGGKCAKFLGCDVNPGSFESGVARLETERWQQFHYHLIRPIVVSVWACCRNLRLGEAAYFQRRWVYGEMALAKKKQVFLGPLSLNWSKVSHMHAFIRDFYINDRFPPILFDNLNRSTDTRKSLAWVLERWSYTVFELPHDQIYAFIGLSRQSSSFPILYGCSTLELLLGTVIFCLTERIAEVQNGMLESPIASLDELWAIGNIVAKLKVSLLPSFSATIPEAGQDCESSGLLKYAVEQCPSKFNVTFWTMDSLVQQILPLTDSIELIVTPPPFRLQIRELCEKAESSHLAVLEISCANQDKGLLILLLSRSESLPAQARSDFSSEQYIVKGRLLVGITYSQDFTMYLNAEQYGSNGLPGIWLQDFGSTGCDFVVPRDHYQAMVILAGLPEEQNIRAAAFQGLYEPVGFALEEVKFSRFSLDLRDEDSLTEDRQPEVWWAPAGAHLSG